MNKPRVLTFCYQWPGTKNNHAGMAYFASCLKRGVGFPLYLFYNSPQDFQEVNWKKYLAMMAMPWVNSLFFMEYLSPIGIANQERVAGRFREWGVKAPMAGLVHLPECLLVKYWTPEYIRSALDTLDHVIVYGSSLTRFFERIGYGHKVRQTFHYVDTDYYHPLKDEGRGEFKVIVCGSLLRDIGILEKVVRSCPEITFQVCAGINDLKARFSVIPNVELYGYLPEDDLRLKMQQANVALSVMEDTVGSNAIVSALACGLPQVVSDVGSIRDYCTPECALFCKEPDDYVQAIRMLHQNRDVCLAMGKYARGRALSFSLQSSVKWFRGFFETVASGARER